MVYTLSKSSLIITTNSCHPITSTSNIPPTLHLRPRPENILPVQLSIGLVTNFIVVWCVSCFADSLAGSTQSDRITVRLCLGQCKECARFSPKVEPRSVDFDYFRMRFVVHFRFAEQLERLNESSGRVARASEE